jgi:hypothetical protein
MNFLEKYATKYIMAPNTTIYQGDTLWLNEKGQVRPATSLDFRKSFLEIRCSDFGKGKNKYKQAAEYKVSGDEPIEIYAYDDIEKVIPTEEAAEEHKLNIVGTPIESSDEILEVKMTMYEWEE